MGRDREQDRKTKSVTKVKHPHYRRKSKHTEITGSKRVEEREMCLRNKLTQRLYNRAHPFRFEKSLILKSFIRVLTLSVVKDLKRGIPSFR